MKNVLWFTPAYPGHVSLATFLQSHAVGQLLQSKGINMGVSGISTHDIAWVRNFALTVFYDVMPYYTHLLMVDSDIAIPPELVLDMLNFDEPVVGGIYRKKSVEVEWAASSLPHGTEEIRGQFLEVEGIPGGAMLIRRDAVTMMLERMPHLSDERENTAVGFARDAGCKRLIRAFDTIDNESGGVVSEDIAFCRRWRGCGGKVWGAVGHSIPHIGLYSFEGSFIEHSTTKKNAELAAAKQAAE